MKLLLLLLTLVYYSANAVPIEEYDFNGTNWVVLASGGGMSLEYSIEADVYHAYQVVRSRGIPDKNIIVMNLDEVAYSKRNPTPGIVVSKPGGPDVYHGVPKDYVHEEVTPLNFLAILRGDPVLARNGKKVVKSGPNDHIFVYFMDHGATDLICFPKGRLYGEELNNQLIEMYNQKKFAKLVFYIEACESGSMFAKLLPKDINVYAVTSSAPTESSYACCYDTLRQEFLAGYFNYHWMLNSEQNDLTKVTLEQQFVYIRDHTVNKDPAINATNGQHAQQYGDLSIGKLPVSLFLGKENPKNITEKRFNINPKTEDLINTRDADIYLLQKRIEENDDLSEKQKYVEKLRQLLNNRKLVDKHFEQYVHSIQHLLGIQSFNDINNVLNTRQELNNRQCYRQMVDTFDDKCLNINKNYYVLQKLNVFVNICEKLNETNDMNTAVNALIMYCNNNYMSSLVENVV
ncbi:legumain-like [Oppia nitens]|uniref:legumain-like n=1 Tax=Oppia nitens TaxID=1686743 RepID=UPI0023DA3425|nr:legumain-like [Oppia nitens]